MWQQAEEELLGAGIEILQAVGHADARIEHHNGRERAHLIVEDGDFLWLAVVEDLEVFFGEIRDEAVVGVDHRHVRRDDARSRPKRRLLGINRQPDCQHRNARESCETRVIIHTWSLAAAHANVDGPHVV